MTQEKFYLFAAAWLLAVLLLFIIWRFGRKIARSFLRRRQKNAEFYDELRFMNDKIDEINKRCDEADNNPRYRNRVYGRRITRIMKIMDAFEMHIINLNKCGLQEQEKTKKLQGEIESIHRRIDIQSEFVTNNSRYIESTNRRGKNTETIVDILMNRIYALEKKINVKPHTATDQGNESPNKNDQ